MIEKAFTLGCGCVVTLEGLNYIIVQFCEEDERRRMIVEGRK